MYLWSCVKQDIEQFRCRTLYFNCYLDRILLLSNCIGPKARAETIVPAGESITFNKYKTFSVLIYSYINTSGNWENEKLCGNTTPEGRSVFTQFRFFPISTLVDITIYINTEKKFYICFII